MSDKRVRPYEKVYRWLDPDNVKELMENVQKRLAKMGTDIEFDVEEMMEEEDDTEE